jgi:hypothetical protein
MGKFDVWQRGVNHHGHTVAESSQNVMPTRQGGSRAKPIKLPVTKNPASLPGFLFGY